LIGRLEIRESAYDSYKSLHDRKLISLHLVSEKYRRAPTIGNNAEINTATATLGAWENSLYMRFLPYLQPERAFDLLTMRVSMDCITQGIIQYPEVMMSERDV
jgi:hypothetical protein